MDLRLFFAELPEPGFYFHPLKIAAFTLCMGVWWYVGAWVDRDAPRVRSNRHQWNALVFGSGLLAAALWVMLPAPFWIGFLVFAVVYGTPLTVYIVFRNRRVAPSQTVMTPAHLNRLLASAPQTDERVHAKDRVRIKGADGKYPTWPTDPVQHEGYQALQDLMFDAIWRRASDVEINLAGQQARILYKVDGVVRERDPILRPQADVVLSHLKRIAGMDPEEIRRPQEGKLGATIGAGATAEKGVEVIVKTFGSTTGQRVQMKMLVEESRFRIHDVGFTKAQLASLEPLIEKLQGLIICCGPKETGLSSLLYSMVRAHDAFMRNIHTLETVKLMEIENVTQHMHDPNGQVAYSRALQSIFRGDPDIVMVSDCPDHETAELCADFAEQKKVYVGSGASDTFEGLRKYLQLVGDNRLAAQHLLAITSGRLIRKLCANCRKGYRPDVALLKKANLPTDQNRPFYRPPNKNEVEVDKQGNPIVCAVCQGSGYYGRTGIFEVLVISTPIRDLIRQGAALQVIRAQARKEQMYNLQEIGLQKVYEGVTSIQEVLRVTGGGGSEAAAA